MPIGRNKIRPNWPIDIAIEEIFREFVVRKHGTYTKGLLGQESNKAYLAYILPYLKSKGITAADLGKTIAHTRIKTDKTSQQKEQAIELRDMIVKYLIEQFGIEKQPKIRVGLAKLKEAICGVTGVKDYRSIRSRLILLESSRLISQPDPEFKIYEIISGYDNFVNSPRRELAKL